MFGHAGRVAALYLATSVFLVGNHISDEERAREKRRRNLRNLQMVPTIVIAHTFCASRDTLISHGCAY